MIAAFIVAAVLLSAAGIAATRSFTAWRLRRRRHMNRPHRYVSFAGGKPVVVSTTQYVYDVRHRERRMAALREMLKRGNDPAVNGGQR